MTINPDRMLKLAQTGFGTMTEVADTIVRETGRSFHVAHDIVGRTVAIASQSGKLADEITPEMLDAASMEVIGEPLGVRHDAIFRALDPVENIRNRTVTGGPAPSELRRMLADRRTHLIDERDRLISERERLAGCEQRLVAEARAFAGTAGSTGP
jgi:argininosuccinate lyase